MAAPQRKIPASGINLFQLIYALIREYEQATGHKALNLSLGNPDQVPPAAIRELKSRFQLRPELEMHTYAEDKNLNQFCEGMIRAFTGVDLRAHPRLRAVPIAGIKTASAILPLACGLHLPDSNGRREFTVVSHLPAYDIIGTWSASYLDSNRVIWPLSGRDSMRMDIGSLKAALRAAGVERPDLVFVIRPGNPASRGATREEWKELIEFCVERGARLVNDGAYTTLSEAATHVPLAQVALDYPELEWVEMLSMSKAFSDPGARLGVLFGSREFVEDFILVKGNTDSGPVPSLMAAYGEFLKDPEGAKKALRETYVVYRARLDYLVPKLKSIGLRMACETTAGFFTLWKVPDTAFGRDLREESERTGVPRAELFNRLVIEKTGIVGVHFQGASEEEPGSGEDFIRYAVCTDVLDPGFKSRFEEAIPLIQPGYGPGEGADHV